MVTSRRKVTEQLPSKDWSDPFLQVTLCSVLPPVLWTVVCLSQRGACSVRPTPETSIFSYSLCLHKGTTRGRGKESIAGGHWETARSSIRKEHFPTRKGVLGMKGGVKSNGLSHLHSLRKELVVSVIFKIVLHRTCMDRVPLMPFEY